MDATAAMELTLFKMHTASSENNDMDVPGPWAWDVRVPRASIFKALERQRSDNPNSIGVRIVGDVDGTVSREYVRDSKIWTRYYHGYRREADAVWTGRRHMALTPNSSSSSSGSGGGAGSSKKSKRAVTVTAKSPKKAGQMLQFAVDMLCKVSTPSVEAAAAAQDAAAAAAATGGSSASSSSANQDPLLDPKLFWVDLPCIAANSPDAADDDDDDVATVNQTGTPHSAKTTTRSAANRAMDAQPLTEPLALGAAPKLRVNATLWKTMRDVDAAAHTLYNAAPSGTLMVVVCQDSLVKLQTLLAQKQKCKWSQKANNDKTGVAGGSKERPWTQDDDQELALAADITMSGVTFLAFKP
jgi:hypothetical protein